MSDQVKGRCEMDICIRTMPFSCMEGSDVRLLTF